MLSMRTILNRARTKLHDEDAITYDNDVIVAALNDGIRFIRRTIAQIQPEILQSETTGTVDAGVDNIELPKRPLFIVEVLAGDRIKKSVTTRNATPFVWKNKTKIYKSTLKLWSETTVTTWYKLPLYAINMRHIFNRYEEGTPTAYYRSGIKTIRLFPVPNKETAYTVRTIDDIEEVTIADNSPLINDFDDFLIEYAALRLSIGNEYDMSQETQVFANIINQIQMILAPPPPGIEVVGYWDAYSPTKQFDYGRRGRCY